MKVIFMGTPGFAMPILQSLIKSQHEIVAVYTKPPKPYGRGYELTKSPVHLEAERHALSVYTPNSLKNQLEQSEFAALEADIAVVAAYGLILPKAILDSTKYGCINVHPSMLPRWRGAAPLQHTILAGDKETEVCIMQMDQGMDTGDILLKRHICLDLTTNTLQLHEITSNMGAELILEALTQIEDGSAVRIPQVNVGVTHARKLVKEDEKIDWQKTAFEIFCQIKTFAPRPAAHFFYDGEMIKIIEAEFENETHNFAPGTVVDNKLKIACKSGFLIPTLLQREGKKMIYTDAFLRGFSITVNTVL